jgi:hypothetical protein
VFDSIGLYPEQFAHVLTRLLATSSDSLQFSKNNIANLRQGEYHSARGVAVQSLMFADSF